MDSAVRPEREESDTKVSAMLFGDAGEDMPPGPSGESKRLFLLASLLLINSACLFGGPLRLLGRSKVHGISRAAQARHGIPDSSHCLHSRVSTARPRLDLDIHTFTFRMLQESQAFRRRFALLPSRGSLPDRGPGGGGGGGVAIAIGICAWPSPRPLCPLGYGDGD